MTHSRLSVRLVFLSVLLIGSYAGRASIAQGQSGPVSEAERTAVVERISELINENYVFPEVAAASADHLRARLADGGFDDVTDPDDFARRLTESLQSINHDKHMRVRIRPAQQAQEDSDARRIRTQLLARGRNHGFETVEHLDGNVGYLDMRYFSSDGAARETGAAAMAFLSNVDALIVDMRSNGGGSPGMVQFMCSYFFGQKTHLNSLYWRDGDRTEEFWTLDAVPGERLPDVPLFVLTGPRTFSGAEEFTYNLKTRERATIIGETTGGGANPGGNAPINDRFLIFIPTGRAINPVTGINWEGTGVTPDVAVAADDAKDVALEMAREAADRYRAVRAEAQAARESELNQELERASAFFRNGKAGDANWIAHSALDDAVQAGQHDEASINLLGYSYLQSGALDMAISVFEFNTTTFAESFNTFDSLAEAYMADGQRELAIKNYGLSLVMNPANVNAIEMLQRLNE